MPTKEQKIHDLAVAYAQAEYKETRDYLRSRGPIHNIPQEDRNKGWNLTDVPVASSVIKQT